LGDVNQKLFLQKRVPSVSGPVLEVGSKDYGNTTSFRDIYQGQEYVGLDLFEGKGVDVIVNLEDGIGELKESSFALVICCSVLEHTPRPWVVAENLTRLLKPGGVLYMSVPWVWRYHAYPDDYFRFSHRAIPSLFPTLSWDNAVYSTNVAGEFIHITPDDKNPDDRMAQYVDVEKPRGKRKYLPYLMVNTIGTRAG
jgi:SAM-dependent methyltransferase